MIVQSTQMSHNEALQHYADEYFSETGKQTATAKEIAVWAIRTGKWEPPSDLLIRQCREEFAKALREQYIKDKQGPRHLKQNTSPLRTFVRARFLRPLTPGRACWT